MSASEAHHTAELLFGKPAGRLMGMNSQTILGWLAYAYALAMLLVGTYVPIKLTDWLYDGESYVVWWIVFLFLWPTVLTVVYGLGMIPVAIVASMMKQE